MGLSVDNGGEDVDTSGIVSSSLASSMSEPVADEVVESWPPAAIPSHDPFKCPVCQQRYRNPLLFPACCHSVCEVCVDDVTVDGQAVCPRCK